MEHLQSEVFLPMLFNIVRSPFSLKRMPPQQGTFPLHENDLGEQDYVPPALETTDWQTGIVDPITIVRRVILSKPDSTTMSLSTTDASSLSSCSPPRNRTRNNNNTSPVLKGNQKRRRHHQNISNRMVMACIGTFLVIGTLYYQGWSRTFRNPARSPLSPKVKGLSELLNSNTVPITAKGSNSRRLGVTPNDGAMEQVVHIVHTRFMQNQPNLIDLGLARLELFRDFTLRSLQEQSSPNFLWVIRTDPSLHASLREPLLGMLKGVDNHLLIAALDNPNVQVNEILSVDPSNVLSGDIEEARAYLQPLASSKPQKILETRLDADDALNVDFVEYMQVHALWDLPEAASQWKIWCSSNHFEWQYHTATNAIDPKSGILLSLKDTSCISAGLTIGYTEGLQVHELPPIKHQQLGASLPSCDDENLSCLDFIDLLPATLRARTPTSAGMMNVILGGGQKIDKRYRHGAKQQEKLQDQLWALAAARFGFQREHALKLREYLKNHLLSIAKDNLEGQCSDGHSCKESSKILLQAIVDNPDAFE